MTLHKFLIFTGFLLLFPIRFESLLINSDVGKKSSLNENKHGIKDTYVQAASHNEFYPILPVPKKIKPEDSFFTFEDTLYIFSDFGVLEPLYDILKEEFKSLYMTEIVQGTNDKCADIILKIDGSLDDETYRITVKNNIEITGGSYRAVSMGTVSVLQSISEMEDTRCIRKGTIVDYPDLPFRGLLIDVARNKHDIVVLKQIISLCRWYKVNYLQLHLTDDNHFRFPSTAYPQLTTPQFHYDKEELTELIEFANVRGIEIIPELEVPGHAGQFIEKMPEIFGFQDEKLNRNTINMANDEIYPVLDTLIGEITDLFHSSRYIHIGGDEPKFNGMDESPDMQQYLERNDFHSVEEVYWHFINRMHEFVKKRKKQTIVWEGFSKEGNHVVSKEIIVMAWETMYQVPSELLDAGFEIINVSWKPLYVVNTRKWDPLEIINWNVYQWQNWLPKAPSYDTIQLTERQNVLGASMASWDQPEYTEISSLRKRLPAMVERVWNIQPCITPDNFLTLLSQTDTKLRNYFSPVQVKTYGLSFPDITDGRRDEQVWFNDTLRLKLTTTHNLVIRYTTDGTKVTRSSPVYGDGLSFTETTVLRHQAYTTTGEPIGQEILHYYELNPLDIRFESEKLIPEDELWERTDSWRIPFYDSLQIHLSAKRPGVIRFEKENSLSVKSKAYKNPITIKDDTYIEAGLFEGDTLIGKTWKQHFHKIDTNERSKI